MDYSAAVPLSVPTKKIIPILRFHSHFVGLFGTTWDSSVPSAYLFNLDGRHVALLITLYSICRRD
jgi:hypothetical protein